jgi:hypothetical protein
MSGIFTAVIVEPRIHKALIYVLNNFLENLDERWNFLIIHGTENAAWLQSTVNIAFSEHMNRIKYKNLNVPNLTVKEYSGYIASKKFLNEIPTEVFLLFQTDTLICAPYKHLIDSFLKYDYVGAPWIALPPNYIKGVGNGGLSLRKRSKMLEILEKVPYNTFEYGTPEDTYFSGILEGFPTDIDIYKPTFEEAMLFSSESVYSPMSFGIHKPWAHMIRITEEQCPGYHMLIGLTL